MARIGIPRFARNDNLVNLLLFFGAGSGFGFSLLLLFFHGLACLFRTLRAGFSALLALLVLAVALRLAYDLFVRPASVYSLVIGGV